MTKEEMLKKSGLSEEQFKQLVSKFKDFLAKLDENQRAAVIRWLPSLERVAASFGPALTAERLAKNIGAEDSSATEAPQQGIGLGCEEPCDD